MYWVANFCLHWSDAIVGTNEKKSKEIRWKIYKIFTWRIKLWVENYENTEQNVRMCVAIFVGCYCCCCCLLLLLVWLFCFQPYEKLPQITVPIAINSNSRLNDVSSENNTQHSNLFVRRANEHTQSQRANDRKSNSKLVRIVNNEWMRWSAWNSSRNELVFVFFQVNGWRVCMYGWKWTPTISLLESTFVHTSAHL